MKHYLPISLLPLGAIKGQWVDMKMYYLKVIYFLILIQNLCKVVCEPLIRFWLAYLVNYQIQLTWMLELYSAVNSFRPHDLFHEMIRHRWGWCPLSDLTNSVTCNINPHISIINKPPWSKILQNKCCLVSCYFHFTFQVHVPYKYSAVLL